MKRIAIAKGDGIGSEIMSAVIHIFKEAGVPIQFEEVEMGKWVYDKGFKQGMTPEAKNKIEELGILFKGPMETPKGSGVRSINVTARKTWNTFANLRIFKTLPGVETIFSKAGIPIHLTIVRENIEDTYGGIEHFLSNDVALCRRFISRPGCEEVLYFAFEHARKMGHKKITCGHKANIMKLTDGLFLETFYSLAKNYPEIHANDVIVDDLCMKLVVKPQEFDVIVLTNLQGDIVSDLCAGLIGGLGFAPSSNIGNDISIFEAVHGTAPDIAGKNIANPTALLLSGLAMLRHLGIMQQSAIIENALYVTLEQNGRTSDFGNKAYPALSTSEFTSKICSNFGKTPQNNIQPDLPNYSLNEEPKIALKENLIIRSDKKIELEINGYDFFIEALEQPIHLIEFCQQLQNSQLKLTGISNRGTQIWPISSKYTHLLEMYCCRFEKTSPDVSITPQDFIELYQKISAKFKVFSMEVLHKTTDKNMYSTI